MSVLGFASLRTAGVAAATMALATVVASEAGAQRRRNAWSASGTLDTTVAFPKNGTVTVQAGSGDIIVNGWSRDQVHVRGETEGDGLRMRLNGGTMVLDVTNARRGDDTKFEVSVPYGVRVVAHSASGDVTVRGTRGAVDINTQSGDIVVDDVVSKLSIATFSGDIQASTITGDAGVKSISGEIRLTNVQGDVDAGTVSGSIELRGVTAKVVHAKTTSGDVVYDGLIDPAGRYDFVAHSGDVRLHVPKDASAQIAWSTWSGEIDSDFPMTLRPGEIGIGLSKAKKFTFSIGGGSAHISAETFSGDITISSNGRGANVRR